MAVYSRPASMERIPLLDDVPLTYNAFDDGGDYTSDTSTLAEPEASEPPSLNKFSRLETCWILAGLWSAVFLGALDGTVVATLLSPIGSHFNKLNQSSYIGTAYLLSVCCFTPLYGRLSDILGRKGAMLLALTLFGSGTISCALAPTMESLIAARAVAGMGGGGVMTVSSIVVTDLIPFMAAFSTLYNIPLRIQGFIYSLIPMMRRTGKLYKLTLCSGLMCILASVSVVFWNENTSPFHLWIDIVPQGFGMASLITTTLIAMIAGVLKEDMAVATGSQVLGVSISGAIFQAVLLQKLRLRIQGPGSAELIYDIQHSTNIISTLDPLHKVAAIESYGDALQIVFICQAVWNFLAFLWCIPIQENVLP
ncbi:hypothetical protein HHX47_DHR5000324 [Lentinula edodes]|nr:hypothetical protein HHX47_DHR5000324 [Lentinula edodes]